jgi:ribosomal-protein-alanine N-acetyltransferase
MVAAQGLILGCWSGRLGRSESSRKRPLGTLETGKLTPVPAIALNVSPGTPPISSETGPGTVTLRPSTTADAPIIFRIESDSEGRHMAAFGGEDSDLLAVFQSRWERMLSDKAVLARIVLWNDRVVGSVLQFQLFEKPSIAYWIERGFWGKGIATRGLGIFLREYHVRPLYARVARDNLASQKVLENCGFKCIGEDKGFARFRGTEIEELIYQLLSS